MFRRPTDPLIERTQRTGYPGPERQAVSGTVNMCVVCLIDHPISIEALLIRHAIREIGEFAVDPTIMGYEVSFIVETRIDTDADCLCETHLEQEAKERIRAEFERRKLKGEMSAVREMSISHVESLEIGV